MDHTTTPPTDPLKPADEAGGANPAAPDATSSPTTTSPKKKSGAKKKGGRTKSTFMLGEFAQQQLERERTCVANGEGKQSTLDNWQTHLKALPAWLNATPLKSITSKHCKTYFDQLQTMELAPSTITVRKVFLGSLLQRALQEAWIDDNPCADLLQTEANARGGTGHREITEADTLSPEQFERVFIVAACLVPPLFFVVVAVILLTGMLGGEARALQLGDLQLNHVCGGVRRPRIRVRWIEHHGTLSLAGWEERYVDVPPLLEGILCWWIDTRGITDPAAWLFPGPLPRTGSKRAEQLTDVRPNWCVAPETLNANWRKIRDRALPGSQLSLTDLRHTFCALSLLLGEDLLYVSLQVGHRAVKYTGRVYRCFVEIARRQPPTPPPAH